MGDLAAKTAALQVMIFNLSSQRTLFPSEKVPRWHFAVLKGTWHIFLDLIPRHWYVVLHRHPKSFFVPSGWGTICSFVSTWQVFRVSAFALTNIFFEALRFKVFSWVVHLILSGRVHDHLVPSLKLTDPEYGWRSLRNLPKRSNAKSDRSYAFNLSVWNRRLRWGGDPS